MLSFWRRKSGWLIHVIFWPIIGVFVIWGFERYGNPAGGAAAVVNDRAITITEYRNALQQMIEFYQQMMGGTFDESMQKRFGVRQAALNELVDQELVLEQGKSMGLVATDAEVRDTIVGIPAFQKDGKFSHENYEGFLSYKRYSASQFEDEIRRDILRRKTQRFFDQNIQPSPLEVEKEKELRSVKMNVEFLALAPMALEDKITVSASDAEKFLADPGQLKEAKSYFDIHQSDYSKPEEVHARHILIKAMKGAKDGDAQDKAAQAKIAQVQNELKGGADFAALAKKYSEDPGSKDKGGDLGWFSKEKMVHEFADAAFGAQVGAITGPVRTSFGYHMIKVEEKHPAQTADFEKQKVEIAKKLIAQKRVDSVLADVEKKISTDSSGALKQLQGLDKNAKWEETGFFTAADVNIPKIGTNEDLVGAALSLTEKNPVYAKLIHSGATVYALRLKKSEPAPATDDAKVKDDLEKQYARDLFASWAGGLRAHASIDVNRQLIGDEQPTPED